MNPVIRPEELRDVDAICTVNRLAFGGDDEANLVDALREQGHVQLSLVATENDQVIGHILFSDLPIITANGAVPALALAPMAVRPDHQKRGVGSALVRQALAMCRDMGQRIVVVLGHPEYYSRFGFSPALARTLDSPFGGGDAFMALELVPGALDGVAGRVQYAPPFGALE